MIPIQPDEILTLTIIHALYLALIGGLSFKLLPGFARWILLALALAGFAWSLGAMLSFWAGNTRFLSWFLDPSAEQNLSAIVTSTLLLTIGLTALALLLKSTSPPWQRVYWLLLAVTFVFLAVDEYTSLHEAVVFWRGAYIILGGSIGLLSVAMVIKGDSDTRRYVGMYLLGLISLGFGGVFLDSFSTQNLLDIGPIKFYSLMCDNRALGVQCRDFSNTEELLEWVGASVMWVSLLALLRVRVKNWQMSQRLVVGAAGAWLLLLVGWLWIFPAVESRLAETVSIEYEPLSVTGYSLSHETLVPGETLDVTVYAQANHDLNSDYSMSLHLYTYPMPDVKSVAQDDMLLGEFNYPTRAWIPGLPVRNRFHLQIPADLAHPMSYRLVMIVWQEEVDNKLAVQESAQPTFAEGEIVVLEGIAAPQQDTPPAPEQPRYVFNNGIRLHSYQLPETVTSGEAVTVRFWWQTENAVQQELFQFLHWFHTETGEYVIFDQVPFNGLLPTQDWPTNLFVMDAWQVTLPDDTPPGTYRLQTGLARVEDKERVPAADAAGNPVIDSSIVLGEVVVEE